MKTNSFSTRQYNSLVDVTSADRKAREGGRLAALLEEAADCFIDFDVNEYYSIELLHKHNSIETGEIMLEDEEVLEDGTPALTTMKMRRPLEEDSFSPSSFKLTGGALIPLEFSRDPVVNSVINTVTEHDKFLKAYYSLLAKYEVNEIIGLGFAKRQFYANLRSNQILVEESDPTRAANVITVKDREAIDGEDLISTSWAFERAIKRCYIATVCVKVCIRYSPGHGREHRKGTQHRQSEEA